MKYKYCFVGAHGCGKSSAAGYLGSLIKQNDPSKSVKVIEENVREVSRIFFDKINTPDFQKLCMVDHLQKEFLYGQLYDVVVCDRTALDTLVYGQVYKISLPPEYFSLALNHLKEFDTIFFVRPNNYAQQIVKDGFRDTNTEIRNEVDKQFEYMLNLAGVKYKELKTEHIFKYDYINNINVK